MMRAGRVAAIALAGVLALAGCGEPGHVVKKSTEGMEVTGKHFVWCKRSSKTIKVAVTYKEYVSTRIGDPC